MWERVGLWVWESMGVCESLWKYVEGGLACEFVGCLTWCRLRECASCWSGSVGAVGVGVWELSMITPGPSETSTRLTVTIQKISAETRCLCAEGEVHAGILNELQVHVQVIDLTRMALVVFRYEENNENISLDKTLFRSTPECLRRQG